MERKFIIAASLALLGALVYAAFHLQDAYELIPANLDKPVPLSPHSEWREFASGNGAYIVSFPDIPQHATDSVHNDKNGETRHYDMKVAQRGNGVTFVVTRITFDPDRLPTEKALTEYSQEVVNSAPGNRLVSEEEAEFVGQKAITLLIENPKAMSHAKVFFVDSALYLLMVMIPRDLADQNLMPSGDIQYFFDSFRILPASGKSNVSHDNSL